MLRKKLSLALASVCLSFTLALPAYAAPAVMPDGGVFDADYYAATYPDVSAAFGNDVTLLYQHYKTNGIAEGRLPYAPGTDVNAVIAAYQAQAAKAAKPKKKMSAKAVAAQQAKQINNPSEDFVVSRLACVPNITGIEPATEDHDPNNGLHKAGSYTSAVFFSYALVDQTKFSYKEDQTIVGKGTECGGSVEVYETAKDANKRNKYLSCFDGAGFLNSGSHTVVGTMVIRTSKDLTATQQSELTQNITNSMMYVEQ